MKPSVDLANWQALPDATQLTIKEVAAILRVSANQVYNTIRAGHLPACQLKAKGRGTYRIEKQALEEYLYNCRVAKVPRDRKPPLPRASGKTLKHIKPTWLQEPSQQKGAPSPRSNVRNPRSRGGSCGPAGRQ